MTTHAEYAQNTAWSGRGTLTELVGELERRKNSCIDTVVDTRQFEFAASGDKIIMVPLDSQAAEWGIDYAGMPVKSSALSQLAQACGCGIDSRSFRKLLQFSPDIAADLLNDLNRTQPKRRLVRMLDGQVRA